MKHFYLQCLNKYQQAKEMLLTAYRKERGTMRGRFGLHFFLIIGMCVSLLCILLFGTGLVNPFDYELGRFLDNDLRVRSRDLMRYYDNLAARNLVFSQQLTENTMLTLKEKHAKIGDLNNNAKLLLDIQNANYDIVKNNLQQSSCSGAFYLLNATVNDKNPVRTYSGIYLKYAYLYSDNMLANDWFMFRGDYLVAQENNLELFNTWQLEMDLEAAPETASVLRVQKQPLAKSFLLTNTIRLSDTWERVRLLVLPIYDGRGNNIGICGYEISSIYYQLRSQPSYFNDSMVLSGVLNFDGSGKCTGQFNNENAVGATPLTLEERGNYTILRNEMGAFVGKTMEQEIAGKKHLLVSMIPESVYNDMRHRAYLKIGAVLLALLVLCIGGYYFFAQKYIDPLVDDLQQLAKNPKQKPDSGFEEIDSVYSTWKQSSQEQEDRLRKQEELLSQLDLERKNVKEQYNNTVANLTDINNKQKLLMEQYQQLLDELQRREDELRVLQVEKQEAEQQYENARASLADVMQKNTEQLDEYSYEIFVSGLAMLTPKEQEVFDCYVEGMSPKEVVAKMFISENTLKFHNRNIYGKLGVKSRKELLRGILYWQSKKNSK